jgi:hypothetical protein
MNKIELKGVNYDVGVRESSINLPVSKLTEEIGIIRNELHCNAVRIYGRDLEKLVECSNIAIKEGLTVWFSPRLINASFGETLEYIKLCSIEVEKLRKISPSIVYVIGNEFSLDLKGFVEGETTYERILNLSKPISLVRNSICFGFRKELNIFLQKTVSVVRQYFKGEITYASGQWEKVNWEPFDIISINYYRNRFNGWKYRSTVRRLAYKRKKLAITEFGCCSYKGADKKGAWGYSIVDWNESEPILKTVYKRDEDVQAKYLIDLLNIYLKENVYAAFIYTFVARRARYNVNHKYDLDMANFGLIKVLPPGDEGSNNPYSWGKKKAFNEISKFYSSK